MLDLTIQDIGKHHFYQTVYAAVESGCSVRFITRYYTKKKSLSYKVLRRIVPEGHLESRYNSRISEATVTSFWFLEALERANMRWCFWNCSPERQLKRFSRLASHFVPRTRAFHAPVFGSVDSIIKAKEQGSTIVLDHSTTHVDSWIENLRNESLDCSTRNPSLHFLEFFRDSVIIELRLADFILCPSINVLTSLKQAGISDRKIKLIPYGVDIDLFRPGPKNDDKFRVIFVGGIIFHKGVQYLLEAFEKSRIPNSELLLIGHIDESFEREFKVSQKSYVSHIPYVSNQDLPQYYQASSVFVMPSLAEGLNLSTMEAMACGLPVIVTQFAQGIVQHNENGVVVPCYSSASIEEGLKYLHANKDVAVALGNNARSSASRYTWDHYRENYARFILGLLSDRNDEDLSMHSLSLEGSTQKLQ